MIPRGLVLASGCGGALELGGGGRANGGGGRGEDDDGSGAEVELGNSQRTLRELDVSIAHAVMIAEAI